MRVLMFYANHFKCTPTIKTLQEFPDETEPVEVKNAVLAFIHVEQADLENINKSVTKLIKNIKWLLNKTNSKTAVLHSFAHLAEEKADPVKSFEIFSGAHQRLKDSDYDPVITSYGYFNDLNMDLPGEPIARIYKQL